MDPDDDAGNDEDFMGFHCLRCGQCVQEEDEMDDEEMCPLGPWEWEDGKDFRPCNYSETLIHETENGEWVVADEQ